MTETKTFLDGEFLSNSGTPENVPGFTFTVPANAPARLRLEFLYSAPPDVDAVLSISAINTDFAYAGIIRDGAHGETYNADQSPDGPQNFTPVSPAWDTAVELPGKGILFSRTAVLLDYYFIGGGAETTFTVQFSQKAAGNLPSYLHWGFAEFKTI